MWSSLLGVLVVALMALGVIVILLSLIEGRFPFHGFHIPKWSRWTNHEGSFFQRRTCEKCGYTQKVII